MVLFAGFGMMQGMTASNTIMQTLVPEDKRGRVMSYYTVAFVGMAPFGSLLAGALAHWIGAPRTVMFTGSVVIVGAIWFTSRLGRGCRRVASFFGQPRISRWPHATSLSSGGLNA